MYTPPGPCVALHTAVALAWSHTTAMHETLQYTLRIGQTDQPMHHSSAACNGRMLALRELESALGMAQ